MSCNSQGTDDTCQDLDIKLFFPNISLIRCLLDVQCVRVNFGLPLTSCYCISVFGDLGGGAGAQNLLVDVHNYHAPNNHPSKK